MNDVKNPGSQTSDTDKASKEWHPNAPMNPDISKAQPQPVSTPDPESAKLVPPVVESDDKIEHLWRPTDNKEDYKGDH